MCQLQVAVQTSYQIEPPTTAMAALNALSTMKTPLRATQLQTLGGILDDQNLLESSSMQAEASKFWFCPSLFQVVTDLVSFKKLLSAVFLEKQIVCYGNKPHLVSGVILGLESLLRPFQWKMALIPILPKMLLDFVEAPLPLLAGITKEQFEQVSQCLSPE